MTCPADWKYQARTRNGSGKNDTFNSHIMYSKQHYTSYRYN